MSEVPQNRNSKSTKKDVETETKLTKCIDPKDDQYTRFLLHGSDNIILQRRLFYHSLDACGARGVELPGPASGSLTTETHNLFKQDKWPLEDFTTTKGSRFWTALIPALQLASNFLLSEPALAVFRHIKYGREEEDVLTGRTNLVPADTTLTESQQNDAVKQDLEKLATHLRFLFGVFQLPEDPTDRTQTLAVHTVSQKEFGDDAHIVGDDSLLPEDDNKTHYIVMNQAYKAFISRKMKTSYELVRFAVGFAITLVHELTHAFYARDRTDGDEEYKEPFLNVDQCCRDGKAELGSAMEHALFKNPIIQVIHPIRGSAMEWERVLKQTRDDHRVVDVVSSVTFYVSPIWLYRFLTQEFWDGLASAAAPLEVFFLGVAQATQGACLDPTDNQLRWGVRELDANIEATRKNFDVGENRRPPPENLSRSAANA
jgi:hypothetical protein